MSKAPQSFSWGRLIAETKMNGLTAMIACHCEPTFYNADTPFIRLELNENMSALKDSPAANRFRETLTEYFGEGLEIQMIDGPAKRSPAMMASEKKMAGYRDAYTVVMNDDLINKMIKEFGGKVLVESVNNISSLTPAKKP